MHIRRSRLRPRCAARRGFTLVELLVAVVLINVGLLALVGASAAAVHRHFDARARENAMRTAAARLERLSGTGCEASTGTATHPGGVRETWSSTLLPNRIRELADSVAPPDGGPGGAIALRTRVPC